MNEVKLIEGNFSPAEAKEIFLRLISSKIQYHTLKSIRPTINGGKIKSKALKRIKELKQTRKNLIILLEEAEKNNLFVEVQSSITISCISRKQVKEM